MMPQNGAINYELIKYMINEAIETHMKKINENDGFQDEYNPSVEEAVDMALYLLGCVYSNEGVAKYLHQHIPAMDYWKPEKKE